MKKYQSLLLIIAILSINLLVSPFNIRMDLTEEKRFTLSPQSVSLIKDIKEVVYIKIYLEGEFPAGFKRLQRATIEMLNDFSKINGLIEYDLEDPGNGTVEEVNKKRADLAEMGIRPTNLIVKDKEGRSEKLIYPFAIIYYKGRNTIVNLLNNQVPGMPQEVVLNNSVSLLEYKFIEAISRLDFTQPKIVAFLDGHGEASKAQTADLEKELRKDFDTGRFFLDSVPSISNQLSALIIVKPNQPFSEKDKFKIDQYVMNGGKVLWLLDALEVNIDSLRGRNEFFPPIANLELDDLLFKYGLRIQPNLVLDLQSTSIPLAVGFLGNAPQFEFFKYPYHLVSVPRNSHPILKNLGPVNFNYASEIDTSIKTKTNLQKTVLLSSSDKTFLQYAPLSMNFDFLRYEQETERYDKGSKPLAVLVEGEFPSLYENRVSVEMLEGLNSMNIPFLKVSQTNKMIVVADGDLAINDVDQLGMPSAELGFNEFDKFLFSNKEFLVNSVKYLLDERGLLASRSKEIKLRMMNTAKANQNMVWLKWVNVFLPVGIIFIFGALYFSWKKKKYSNY
jgi:ABC-2 type transport system permease protein